MLSTLKMKIVLTNGVYDIIHPGHISLLKYCKSLGDYLIVAIDTDRRVSEIKGPNRPVNNQEDRRTILESIKYVDEVILFDSQQELIELYTSSNCNILVKSSEYTENEIRSNGVPDHIEIKLCPHICGKSSTDIMKKIRNMKSCEKC